MRVAVLANAPTMITPVTRRHVITELESLEAGLRGGADDDLPQTRLKHSPLVNLISGRTAKLTVRRREGDAAGFPLSFRGCQIDANASADTIALPSEVRLIPGESEIVNTASREMLLSGFACARRKVRSRARDARLDKVSPDRWTATVRRSTLRRHPRCRQRPRTT